MSVVVEERRAARVGTVSGLALLVGGTAAAAVTGGTHSVFATIMLGLLTAGMGHALLDEIRRQARRGSAHGWARHDTVNTLLLASWSVGALVAAGLLVAPVAVRAVGLTLSLGYAVSCAYFVIERRRTIMTSGGTANPSPSTAGSGTQSSPTASGPLPSPTPSTASPSSTETRKTEVIPDGYGISHR